MYSLRTVILSGSKTGMRLGTIILFSLLLANSFINLAGAAPAQTFTPLYEFTAVAPGTETNSDGAMPQAGVAISGNALYGAAFFGGSSDNGTLFEFDLGGSGFSNLYNFTTYSNYFGIPTNTDGANPQGALIVSGNIAYGTAFFGGANGRGAIFRINTDGSDFANIYNFTMTTNDGNNDGASPSAGLIVAGNTLYGTTTSGGTGRNGTVFAVDTSGMTFTTLYTFSAITNASSETNADGASPQANLLLSGNMLYGTASVGGTAGYGTIFSLASSGSNFTALYSFTNGLDGAYPYGGLAQSGDTLYGTAVGAAYFDGGSGDGTIYKIRTDGTGFQVLYTFTGGSDGAFPSGSLTLTGDTLYGTAIGISYFVSSAGDGTIFELNTNGTGFQTLYAFTNGTDGAAPLGQVTLSGNTLYGTTSQGGASDSGTIYSLTLPSVSAPVLNIVSTGANIVLTWPTNSSEFTLQCSPSLSPTVWSNVCPAPIVLNGNFTVTNAISGSQQYYRLTQ
jgi:uncharacterized repeat protein (TIGR03803 family)